MLKPFSSSQLKLRRAMRHIEELESIILIYFSEKWFSCSTLINDSGEKSFHVKLRTPPEEIAMIVGDAIHNMRSALDLAAVELVALNDQDTKGVMFPFARNEQEFSKAMGNKNIDRASKVAQELIKALKPYGGGDEALRSLHDLDIQDKHHTLIPHTAITEFPPIGVKTDEFGNPLGFSEGKVEIYMDETVPPKLNFLFPEDSSLKGQDLRAGLRDFHAMTTAIIQSFEKLDEAKRRLSNTDQA